MERKHLALTEPKIRALKDTPSLRYVSDGDGLFLLCRGASRRWILRFRQNGRQKDLSLGTWPKVPLAEARQKASEAREQASKGVDVVEARRAEKAQQKGEASLSSIAEQWMRVQTDSGRWNAQTAESARRRFLRDVLPRLAVGDIDGIASLSRRDLLAALKNAELQGAETAKRALIMLRGIFAFALASGLIEADPTSGLERLIVPPRHVHHPCPPVEALGGILRSIRDEREDTCPSLWLAQMLHPLTAVRPGELVAMRWDELDMHKAEWTFTPSKVKNAGKFTVPLSRQALDIIRKAAGYSQGVNQWVFPSPSVPGRHVAREAMRAGLIRLGIPVTAMTPHSWRAIFRTYGAECLGARPEVLEAALAHKPQGALGDTYNRATYLEERRELMQRWADFLDGLAVG